MKRTNKSAAREVPLPFSDGLLSAKLWQAHDRFVVGVPELGLCCYGSSEAEASFRLFTTLIKYYRQLKAFKERLGEKGRKDLVVLTRWMQCIEDRLSSGSETPSPIPARSGKLLTMTPRRML
jgi:hypothetical protein